MRFIGRIGRTSLLLSEDVIGLAVDLWGCPEARLDDSDDQLKMRITGCISRICLLLLDDVSGLVVDFWGCRVERLGGSDLLCDLVLEHRDLLILDLWNFEL